MLTFSLQKLFKFSICSHNQNQVNWNIFVAFAVELSEKLIEFGIFV